MKSNISRYSPLVVIFGILLSRFVVVRYGTNSRAVMVAVLLVFLVSILIIMLWKRQYTAVLFLGIMILPMIIMGIGIILDKPLLVVFGLVLEIIVILMLIKIIPKFKKN